MCSNLSEESCNWYSKLIIECQMSIIYRSNLNFLLFNDIFYWIHDIVNRRSGIHFEISNCIKALSWFKGIYVQLHQKSHWIKQKSKTFEMYWTFYYDLEKLQKMVNFVMFLEMAINISMLQTHTQLYFHKTSLHICLKLCTISL